MPTHISVRLAWHDSGWNGHICKSPNHNAHCVGPYSFPGDIIALKRDLQWEEMHKEKPCGRLNKVPPCCYSINAFGTRAMKAEVEPPEFFKDHTKVKKWELSPASVCPWPYEEMYSDEAREGDRYSAEKRKQTMRKYFSKIEIGKSLIFYYANYRGF